MVFTKAIQRRRAILAPSTLVIQILKYNVKINLYSVLNLHNTKVVGFHVMNILHKVGTHKRSF